jgi:hypothetical protein
MHKKSQKCSFTMAHERIRMRRGAQAELEVRTSRATRKGRRAHDHQE